MKQVSRIEHSVLSGGTAATLASFCQDLATDASRRRVVNSGTGRGLNAVPM